MKSQQPPAASERSDQLPQRKAYQKPRLQVYGDLAEMTRSNSGSMGLDGSGHPNMRYTS